MRKPILLHHCRHADEDGGLDFRCDCEKRVTKLQADWLIRNGSFVVKKVLRGDGNVTHDLRQLVPCGEIPRLKVARAISEHDIVRAYASDDGRYARKRIEEFREGRYEQRRTQ